MRRALMAVALAVVALLGQGCTNSPLPIAGQPATPREGPTAPKTSPGTAGPAASSTQPQQKAPGALSTSVKPKVDQDHAQSVLIAASSGGKIELKAAGGITYTLEIPKDALLSDEIITMAPVAQIDGLPLSGGLLGAVDLRPEGMRLVKPATLTIQVPAGFKAADLIGFAYQGGGEDFHLYPVSAKGAAITASLMHFSSYGGGQGTQADSQAQQGKTPSTAESQFEQEMGAALDNARRTGGDASNNQQAEDVLRNFFDSHVSPDLQNAETNDQSFDAAKAEYLSWVVSVDSLTMDDRFQAEFERASRSLEKGLKNAIDKASQRCVQDLDWEQGLKMIDLAATAQRLNGMHGFSGAGMDLKDIRPQLDQCWKFRLDYESIVTWELPDNMDITAHVKSQVPLSWSEDTLTFNGKAPLQYVEYKVKWRGESSALNALCDIETDTTNTTLSVSPMILPVNFISGVFPQIRGLLDPGDTTEKWSWVCSTGGSGTVKTEMPFPSIGWSMGFRAVNKKRELYEFVDNGVPQGKPKYLFDNFQEVGKPVIARETGTGTATVEGSKVTEEYAIDIVHMPKGGANDTPNPSSQTRSTEPARKPVGPKTVDASALPTELQSIPGPPGFGVVDGSITRAAPEGPSQFAQASWWGTGSISETTDFYRQALAADWTPGDEMVGQSNFDMDFVSKADGNRTLVLNGETDSGGIRVLETVQQK